MDDFLSQVRSLFDYNPETGVITWKVRKQRASPGDRAGVATPGKPRKIGIDGKVYPSHVIIWLLVHGKKPPGRIERINGDSHDDRLANLRPRRTIAQGKPKLTQERVKELLHYDPETGIFTWRVNGHKRTAGQMTGSVRKNGYLAIGVEGTQRYAHRLAWFYVTGNWPPDDIDHINGDRADNRWCNLRLATRSENLCNMKPRRKDGNKNITRSGSGWAVNVRRGGKTVYCAWFKTKPEAVAAAKAARDVVHGEFARHE